MSERIFHAFQWKLTDLTKELSNIQKQNFTAIQISPIQPCKLNNPSDDWWKLYQVFDFTIGNCLGNKSDLINLCSEADKFNLKIIVDVVVNHTAGVDSGDIIPHQRVSKRLTSNPFFWKSFSQIHNWEDRNELVNKSIGLPSLRLDNYELQDIIIEFLNELIDCGVSGVRVDAGKHIATKNQGSDFFIRVFNNLKRQDLFNYAEVIFSSKEIIDEYSQYINVLTDSFGSDKNKLVTFVDSHDLCNEFHVTDKMSDEMIIDEYCKLTENFPNTIWYCRPFNNSWMNNKVKEANMR